MSPIKNAIVRGMRPGGDLYEELNDLGDYSVNTREEAEAICEALATQPESEEQSSGFFSRLHALTSLFQTLKTPDCEAFPLLLGKGIPELIRIVNQLLDSPSSRTEEDLLFVLKILALYGTREGTQAVITSACHPLKPDSYMWSVILREYTKDHPQTAFLFAELSEPLPSSFIAIALLDAANGVLIDGGEAVHPFASPAGVTQLEAWLTDTDPEHYSYAHSAAAALPFIPASDRENLLILALQHVDPSVQMEGAWAAGKLDRPDGLDRLAQFCLDVHYAQTAKHYLQEMGRDSLIPPAAQEADFAALADFSQWLAHPNELGHPPDLLKIMDHRVLAWPPDRKPKPFWLILYQDTDKTGMGDDDINCGLVGSVTFCFFSYRLHERPPEDAYAIHCYWEMQQQNLLVESDLDAANKEYDSLLLEWTGPALSQPQLTRVADISPNLNYPQRLVGVATATLAQQAGWVILDGPRSSWYPRDQQPAKTTEDAILMIHVGRQLLGFGQEIDRRKFFRTPTPPPPQEQIIQCYEKLLHETVALPTHKQTDKLDYFTLLGRHFEAYVTALISTGQPNRLELALTIFEPHWDHNSGNSALGKAAFRAGLYSQAEKYLLKLLQSHEEYYCGEEMVMLAELWHLQGQPQRAFDLLLDCLRQLASDSQNVRGMELHSNEVFFQAQRSCLLKLFPDTGPAALEQLNIPLSLLKD